MSNRYRNGPLVRVMRLAALLLLLSLLVGRSQTFYALSAGNYSQDFADITNWTNNFASGVGAQNYRTATSVATSLVTQPIVFVSGSSGGVQKGTGNIVLLATGSSGPQNEAAFDLLLNFSSRTAGTLAFDYGKVVNSASTTPRTLMLKVQ